MPPGPVGPPDPNGLGVVAGNLGNRARKDGRISLAVVAVTLDEGETVEALIVGRHQGHPAALVLTERGLLLVDERQWKPHVERITITSAMQVQGMQDRTATLTIFDGSQQWVIDQIGDANLAVEMAQRIRYRASIA